MADTCVRCGNPLAENSVECDICGAMVLGREARFLDRHPLLRRGQELGIALLTLVVGLALGIAIIIAIQLNRSPASAQPINGGSPLPSGTPQFVPAIIATPDATGQPTTTLAPTANPRFAARDLLAQATSSMAALHSYQASGNLTDASANASYSFDAAVAPPDEVSITVRNAAPTPGAQFRAVFYNSTFYTSSDSGATWQTDSSAPIVRFALTGLWSGFDSSAITAPDAVRLIGHEQVGSVSTTHLQTDLATLAQAHSLLRMMNLGSDSGNLDIWVSDSDATIQRLHADLSDGKDRYQLDLTFSNLDGTVQIDPPTK